METKSFLLGYIAGMANLLMHKTAPAYKQNSSYHCIIETCGQQVLLMTKSGEMTFGINMGIMHVDGNLVAAASPKFDTEYRIRREWCSDTVLDSTYSMNFDWQYDEENINQEKLIEFIDMCGGIDYEGTISLWLSCSNKTFYSFT